MLYINNSNKSHQFIKKKLLHLLKKIKKNNKFIPKDIPDTDLENITNTTASTSSTTGALVVSGGVGVSGNVELGSYLDVIGATNLASTSLGAN